MFKRHYEKRSTSIPFVIFRLILSMVMFVVLLAGVYTAYKHFSGYDPLKLDLVAVINNVIAVRTPKQFKELFSTLKIDPKILGRPVLTNSKPNASVSADSANLLFKFLLVTDSHNDNANLDKAISQAKSIFPDLEFIIGLGDYTETGTIKELAEAKAILDQSALRYFLVPGDHDLWDCRNRGQIPTACFTQIFGPAYQAFVFNNVKFLLLDNSDNYTGFDTNQLTWLTEQLDKAKAEGVKNVLVFMHEPVYHPSSDHVMGWVEKNLKPQASQIVFQFKEAGVNRIFAGHIHYFSDYSEPKTGLEMITAGAVTTASNPQIPRFAVVSIFDNGVIKTEDVEVK